MYRYSSMIALLFFSVFLQDPLTGFGTPDYIKWAKLALSMQ